MLALRLEGQHKQQPPVQGGRPVLWVGVPAEGVVVV